MKKFFIGLFMLTFALIAGCSSDDNSTNGSSSDKKEEKIFKIGALPDQNAADLSRSMDVLAKYFSKETGLKVEYVPSVDYAALVTAFERGEIDMAWFGGLTGVQARNLVPEADAIAQRPIDKEFHSIFIAQKDVKADQLDDLKGLNFTFGSESSTSGHLMPRYFMEKAGINPDKDFDGQPNYSGSHDKTYKLVESGAFKAGVLNESVWEAAVAEKKVDLNKVKVVYKTPSYYDYHWTINKVDDKFGKGTKDNMKEAILAVNKDDADLKEFLDLFQTDSFIETKNENYKEIEEVAKELEIIK
ncbi:putative selenate ABC transporter substrate-binding protein [Peribacillus cavernae]|uniref:Putative selenate ABC transporter substrate-binding protein n=1 Tax=Peribacillus cavernae TaxID=1674310 RepID=A0A433HE92_9BACI|nr:putative selenate ABC transporter substrate-binding protein [Peribacillus cavernae]MDQ0219889.1 phosphonate transport system substrate-binding protein [Peribacillus cavernae]RUQ26628.1 putative selenate ABC transporter substrate-binding protein [Peribacillus cavernae]